jgi:type IV fimbrial biogenesis protein FimT
VTLLEMLITLAIAAILMAVVVPNFSLMITKSKVTAEVNKMSAMLQHSRFIAIDEHLPTLICPSADFQRCDFSNWQLPKIMFADANFNKERDADEALIYASESPASDLIMRGPRRAIQFYEDGAIASPASILICPVDAPTNLSFKKLNRALFLSLQGRVRLSKDTNGDEVHERGSGRALTCV